MAGDPKVDDKPIGGWKKTAADIAITVLTSPQVKEMLRQLLKEEVLPMAAVLGASAAKSAVDQIVAKTPGLEGVVDLAKTTDDALERLTDLLPGIKIPSFGDFFRR